MKNSDILLKLESITEAEELLARAAAEFDQHLLLASSLSVEDQVLTHMFLNITQKPRIFVLDTGRLPQETYDTMEKTMIKYGITYEVCTPPQDKLMSLLTEKGPNSFYHSVENRKECCFIRKVIPLQEKLKTGQAWMTGLRQEQSPQRNLVPMVEWDTPHDMIKLNPLAHWTTEKVWDYIKKNSIPYNLLHDKGYPSIGCAPCTRAIKSGAPMRSGRWWWEDPTHKECGLHTGTRS